MKEFIKKILTKYIVFSTFLSEKKNIKRKKNLFKNIELTKEQEKSVDDIWLKNYGKKISKDWHKLYTSYTGNFDKYYFPEILFSTNLLNKLNPYNRKKYLSDKILTQYLFSELEDKNFKPIKNYIYNCNGYFYDESGIITYKDALNKVKNIGEVIIKPSVDSSSGNNVSLLNIKDGIDIRNNTPIEEILKKYYSNYVIQEKIKQHESFAKLNCTSVNTIRINTYICDEKVYIAPVSMRIGRNGSIVDNAHAGGISVGVKPNGQLKKIAFSEFGEKFTVHPDTKVKFEDYKIPQLEEMIRLAKKYHYRIPHMGIIAWDLTLDSYNNIIIVETNINAPSLWFPQYCNGQSFFGENTEKMIKKLKSKN